MVHVLKIFGIKQLTRLDRCYAIIARRVRFLHSKHVLIQVPKGQLMCENVQTVASNFLII